MNTQESKINSQEESQVKLLGMRNDSFVDSAASYSGASSDEGILSEKIKQVDQRKCKSKFANPSSESSEFETKEIIKYTKNEEATEESEIQPVSTDGKKKKLTKFLNARRHKFGRKAAPVVPEFLKPKETFVAQDKSPEPSFSVSSVNDLEIENQHATGPKPKPKPLFHVSSYYLSKGEPAVQGRKGHKSNKASSKTYLQRRTPTTRF